MLKFKEMQISSGKFREKNDCVVKALAIASGKSYEEAHEILKKHGRKNRRGTQRYTSLKAIREVNPSADFERIKKPNGSQYTFRTISEAFPKGNYILYVRGHAAAMVDGVIEDWAAGTCKRITHIVKL